MLLPVAESLSVIVPPFSTVSRKFSNLSSSPRDMVSSQSAGSAKDERQNAVVDEIGEMDAGEGLRR
jgi:hypothetical protein